MAADNLLFGKYHLGCNYWASNAGCFMWSNWDRGVVERDLELLAGHGLKTLRVFPLWSDFQRLKVHCSEFNEPVETRMGEKAADGSMESRACVDPVMVERFEDFCGMAASYGISLTVMLVTGWMSGRQFRPSALAGRNVFTDAYALKWQVRYVDCVVRRLRGFENIIAWGLGNECNVMDKCPDSETAYAWTALMANTIRAADPGRPIISGMHGLSVDGSGLGWRIEDQGELVDVMTVHPYAYFVKYCNLDPLLSMRATLNTAAESDLYADLTGKPCFCEEIGDLGRTMADEESAKVYLDTILWSNWANESLGTLWWCAFQQDHISQTPYDWFEFEQDLGLFECSGRAKGVVKSYEEFNDFLGKLPEGLKRPGRRRREAVCILTDGQDNWATALSSYVLAKQAGFDLRFAKWNREIPEGKLYMLPSLCGGRPLPRRNWLELLSRVENDGAILYISLFDGLLPELSKFAGVEVVSQQSQSRKQDMIFEDGSEAVVFPEDIVFERSYREGGTRLNSKPRKLNLREKGCEVLASDSGGSVMLTEYELGRGRVYFLNYGLEMILATNGGTLECDVQDYSKIYRVVGNELINSRCVLKSEEQKWLCLTEHPINDMEIVCAGVNHSFRQQRVKLRINDNFNLTEIVYGQGGFSDGNVELIVGPGSGFVLLLRAALVKRP